MPQFAAALPDPNLVKLATLIQSKFRSRGLSLADPDTAEAYRTTLDSVRPILDGALATGVLDPQQHETLDGMFSEAGWAPDVYVGYTPETT